MGVCITVFPTGVWRKVVKPRDHPAAKLCVCVESNFKRDKCDYVKATATIAAGWLRDPQNRAGGKSFSQCPDAMKSRGSC